MWYFHKKVLYLAKAQEKLFRFLIRKVTCCWDSCLTSIKYWKCKDAERKSMAKKKNTILLNFFICSSRCLYIYVFEVILLFVRMWLPFFCSQFAILIQCPIKTPSCSAVLASLLCILKTSFFLLRNNLKVNSASHGNAKPKNKTAIKFTALILRRTRHDET